MRLKQILRAGVFAPALFVPALHAGAAETPNGALILAQATPADADTDPRRPRGQGQGERRPQGAPPPAARPGPPPGQPPRPPAAQTPPPAAPPVQRAQPPAAPQAAPPTRPALAPPPAPQRPVAPPAQARPEAPAPRPPAAAQTPERLTPGAPARPTTRPATAQPPGGMQPPPAAPQRPASAPSFIPPQQPQAAQPQRPPAAPGQIQPPPTRAQPSAPQTQPPAQASQPGAQPVPPNQRPGAVGAPFIPPGAPRPGQPPQAQPPAQAQPAPSPGQPQALPPNQRPGAIGTPFIPPGAPRPGAASGQPVPPAQAAPAPLPPGQPAQPPLPGQQQPPPAQAAPGLPPGPVQVFPPQAQPPQQARPLPTSPTRERAGMSRGGAAALGLAAGVVGGVMAVEGARRLNEVRERRREEREGDVRIIREPGRTIIRDNDDRVFIRRDENERFRDLGGDMRRERRGGDEVTIFERPNGEQVITVTDADGRLLRRTRRLRDGREIVIINNVAGGPRPRTYGDYIVDLPPPELRIPRERYIVDAREADETEIYEALTAPPIEPVRQRYTLDQVRYTPNLRARMRSVDVDTINFDSGAWAIGSEQANRLSMIAQALKRAIQANPAEVFLIEGHTDAVGDDVDNISLSDRRAQSAAEALTRDFNVPPENLTTQGYGEQNLKIDTQEASRENRRVTVRRITPLLAEQPQQ